MRRGRHDAFLLPLVNLPTLPTCGCTPHLLVDGRESFQKHAAVGCYPQRAVGVVWLQLQVAEVGVNFHHLL